MNFWNWGNNIWNVRDFILSGVAISSKLLSIPNICFYLRIYLLGEQTTYFDSMAWITYLFKQYFRNTANLTFDKNYEINSRNLEVLDVNSTLRIYIYQCSFSWIKSQLSSFMYNTVEARLTVVWKLIYKRHTIQLLFSFKTVHFSFKTQNIHATVVSFSRH